MMGIPDLRLTKGGDETGQRESQLFFAGGPGGRLRWLDLHAPRQKDPFVSTGGYQGSRDNASDGGGEG
ncbi:hypothetical protein ASPCADRAFT_126234 [Aspergillus carbonarius ITEM 5010]|uniref:Uncharacterized protein n=1 Tax=Aspergillus carbonarius (strain ITEM 5010) TaxID=602072 RepID=A0A1R3RXT1_ASPC5|nr:hypothetical protein ASPCADRAFT_126234 [Aspergillus carbonarius ITEM 5010]